MTQSPFKESILFAIEQERKAADLYATCAATVSSRTTRKLLEEMSAMEQGHEQKLREFMRTGTAYFSHAGELTDLRISDYLVAGEITPNSPIEDVFVFAMKAEERAWAMYSRLAEEATDPKIKELFVNLAADEKKHKLDLEREYEHNLMQDN